MSYEDRIQAFWTDIQGKELSASAIAMGLGLLEIWRRRSFPAFCPISNSEVSNLIGTNEKTVRRVRTELMAKGLCWCSSKKGNVPIYYFNESAVPEELKEQPKEVEEPEPLQEPPRKPKAKPRLKPKKVEAEPDLWGQNRHTRAEQKRIDKANEDIQKQKKKTFEPPTLDECVELFQRKGGSKEDAQLFYDYFNRQDWYTSNGRNRIRNVESAINYWINSKKNETGREHITGCTNREKRNRDLQEELIARYGKI
jgi:hypothetical protein